MRIDELWGHAYAAKGALVDCGAALARAANARSGSATSAPLAIAGEPVRYWRVEAARRHFTVAKQHLDVVRRDPAGADLFRGLLDPADVFLETNLGLAMHDITRMVDDVGQLLARIERTACAVAT